MKKSVTIIMLLLFSLLSFAKTKITFINPGKSNETFWVMVSEFMKASAEDLDLELEIIYAERNFLEAVNIMKTITKRQKKPDYVIIVNEKLVAPRLLKVAEQNNIKTFLILNGLNLNQTKMEGIPRGKNKNWLGTLIPNNIDAGYMIADSLIKAAKLKRKDNLELIAIAGNRATPASVDRVKGMKKLLEKKENVKLDHILFAEWSRRKSHDTTLGAINRFGNLDIIWAANDPIAFGAIDAIKEKGLKPGEDILIGGLNWSPEALRKIKKGEMVCSVGGHFMVGGWSLVILKDYSEGKDFIKEKGNSELQINVFGVIDSTNVDEYLKNFGNSDWEKIDFRRFSKYYNPNIEKYDFSLSKILKQF